ncbi:uncharacterized protein LOC132328682 [Haemorhous mexicanus]|uniref:uncharacterized protein LOC132328682 n=1 Tax=Haemorhous mexicanus TaxID=30427 RepID=UPI0028BDC748|nr:uncharacterized protein LOC132328682 [Haemorhous mexicanus]
MSCLGGECQVRAGQFLGQCSSFFYANAALHTSPWNVHKAELHSQHLTMEQHREKRARQVLRAPLVQGQSSGECQGWSHLQRGVSCREELCLSVLPVAGSCQTQPGAGTGMPGQRWDGHGSRAARGSSARGCSEQAPRDAAARAEPTAIPKPPQGTAATAWECRHAGVAEELGQQFPVLTSWSSHTPTSEKNMNSPPLRPGSSLQRELSAHPGRQFQHLKERKEEKGTSAIQP